MCCIRVAHLWPMTSPALLLSSLVEPTYKETAVCVACDKENKCRSHPKVNMKDSQDFAFSTAIVIRARFLFD